MPITRPNGSPLSPVSTATSPDGHLTAMVDTTWDGVLLKVDYSATLSNYPAPFTCVIYRQNPDGTVQTVRSGNPTLSYSGVMYAYDHEAPLGQAVRYWVVPVEYPSQATGTLSRSGWTATASDSDVTAVPSRAIDGDSTTRWQSGTNIYSGMWFQVSFGAARIFNRITLDTGTGNSGFQVSAYNINVSNDGVNWTQVQTGGTASGQTYSTKLTSPVVAKFVRVTANGAVAHQWYISEFSVATDINNVTPGPSDSVVVTIPARAGGFFDPALWLKSISNPSLSMRLNAVDTGSGDFAGQTAPQIRLGNQYPTATFRERQGRYTTIQILTTTMEDFQRMKALAKTNLIMLQSPPGFSREDGYYLIGKVSFKRYSRAQSGIFQWTLELTEFDRPETDGQTLEVPGYSFDEDQQDGSGVGQPPDQATFARDGAVGPYKNLLVGNVSTFGQPNGVSDWSAAAGATISQSTAQAHDGTHSMRVLFSTTGSVDISTIKTINISSSTTYIMRLWVYAPVQTRCDLFLKWYDGSGTLLQTNRQSTQYGRPTLLSNVWTQVYIVATSPSLATTVGVGLGLTSTGSGQVFYVDTVELMTANPLITFPNVLTANQSSFETSVAGWSVSSPATAARSNTQSVDGTYSMQLTFSSAGTSTLNPTPGIAVTGGKRYRFSGWIWCPTSGPSVQVTMTQTDVNNLSVNPSSSNYADTVLSLVSGWQKVVFEFTTETTTALCYPNFRLTATATGQIFYVDSASFGRIIGDYVGPGNNFDATLAWAPV